MFRFRSDKTRFAARAIAILCAILTGCASDQNSPSSSSKKSASSKQGTRTRGSIADGEYYASNWLRDQGVDDAEIAPRPSNLPPIVRDSRGRPLGGDSAKTSSNENTSALPAPAPVRAGASADEVPPLPSTVAAQQMGVWSLVLGTFTEGNATEAAQRMISETQKIAPQVQGLRVHPTGNGAMVVFGEYKDRDDPKQAEDKNWLKSIKFQDQPVFPRIMLTHLDLRPMQADLHPYDLHYARREHPRVKPMYTLDVAVWDDLGSGKLTYAEIQRQAESYAKQLRMTGYEAYFFHDDAAKRSMVTVGLFDKTAINATSGLYSEAVEDLVKRFPARLMNGEPMEEFKDRFRPQLGTRPQKPVLAEVPDT